MARCPRCNACESQWTNDPCKRCDFPMDEQRTVLQLMEDLRDEMIDEVDGGEECRGNDQMLSGWIETTVAAIRKLNFREQPK